MNRIDASTVAPLRRMYVCLALCVHVWLSTVSLAQSPGNLNDLPSQLVVPKVTFDAPAAGLRVWEKLDGYKDWSVAHVLYLPGDWQPGQRYPVIFEYPGNGGFKNGLGDSSDGTVEGCRMGFGITQGKQAIWVCLPFVDRATRKHALNWWGDPDETVRYCQAAVSHICERWGGDPERLVLCGFSRGAIATSYIGLRNDQIASLWRGLMAHSHFDGVRTWPYPDSDEQSAVERQKRFLNRPQWISHELSTQKTAEYLRRNNLLHPQLELVDLPFPNHSAEWLLKDTPTADQARAWWQKTVAISKPTTGCD